MAHGASYYVPSGVLIIGCGVLLVVLSAVLYEAHEHGRSIVDTVAEEPEPPLLAVLETDHEPCTRVLTDTHSAEETPPSETIGGPATSPDERLNGTTVMSGGRLIDAEALRYTRVRVSELPVRQRDLPTVFAAPPPRATEAPSACLGDVVLVSLETPPGMADRDNHATILGAERCKTPSIIPDTTILR